MSGSNNRRRPFSAKNGKKFKNISQLMVSSPNLPASNPATPTISQKFTHLPAAAGRHSKSSEVRVPRPPPPLVLPTQQLVSPDPAIAAKARISIDHFVDRLDNYDADPCYFESGGSGGADFDMDAGDGEWDDVMPRVASEDEVENDTAEVRREKDKLAGVRVMFILDF
jgi:hypothetical protein